MEGSGPPACGLQPYSNNLEPGRQKAAPPRAARGRRANATFGFVERNAFERTQGFLAQLLRYLEALTTSMEWDTEAAGPGTLGLPQRVAQVLTDTGYLEGLQLKSQGLLSGELQEFIAGIGFAFEMEVRLTGPFKLPFVDNEAAIQRKTLNPFMEKAWILYHGALLSAYAMKPLRFEKTSASTDGLEETVRVTDLPSGADGQAPAAALSPETLHFLNNALMGITSYVSLILSERQDDKELQGKLELVLEAARKAAASAKPA